jgi:hypothetical protein
MWVIINQQAPLPALSYWHGWNHIWDSCQMQLHRWQENAQKDCFIISIMQSCMGLIIFRLAAVACRHASKLASTWNRCMTFWYVMALLVYIVLCEFLILDIYLQSELIRKYLIMSWRHTADHTLKAHIISPAIPYTCRKLYLGASQ